jgi:hypothetical protein
MSEGLNFWYGILIFMGIVGVLLTVAFWFGTAAIRLMVRSDYFEDPDQI